MNWAEVAELLNPSALLGTAVFGLILGSLYGWRTGEGIAALWVVGLGFSLISTGAAEGDWERATSRAILWSWLCLVLPVGRRLRLRLELFRLGRKQSSRRRN